MSGALPWLRIERPTAASQRGYQQAVPASRASAQRELSRCDVVSPGSRPLHATWHAHSNPLRCARSTSGRADLGLPGRYAGTTRSTRLPEAFHRVSDAPIWIMIVSRRPTLGDGVAHVGGERSAAHRGKTERRCRSTEDVFLMAAFGVTTRGKNSNSLKAARLPGAMRSSHGAEM